jgi:hypothetical protein
MIVLGTGGIGSNVVRYIDKVKNHRYNLVRLYEMDTVELSNLNRSSLFTVKDIGKNKASVISSNRSNIVDKDTVMVYTHNARVDASLSVLGAIVDCRDTIDPNLLPPNVWLKASYNGGSNMSWHFLPNATVNSIWRSDVNTDSTYEITPSFYVPAAMSGLFIRLFSITRQFTKLDPEKHSRIVRLNIDQKIKQILEEKANGI